MKVIGEVITHRRVKALARGFTELSMNLVAARAGAAVARALPLHPWTSDKTHTCECASACSTETRTVGRRKRKNTEHTRGPESNANKQAP